jgi:hypothetical protein
MKRPPGCPSTVASIDQAPAAEVGDSVSDQNAPNRRSFASYWIGDVVDEAPSGLFHCAVIRCMPGCPCHWK